MTYSSQLFSSSSVHQGLSVDEEPPVTVATGRHLSLSGEYMQRIPGASPSLRHPTRMLKSIENEDTKSAQSSRISIPGSKTSIQGSRPSVFSSQASFLQSGSRSQMFSSALSNEPLGREGGGHRDDDTLSLPLAGRTTSPPLQLNSSCEAPTRDEPSSHPFARSHDLGAGVKDFASMTNIVQHSILSPELGTVRVPLDLDPQPPSEGPTNTRRLSLINCDLGALTTLSDDKSKSEAKESPEAPKKEMGTPKKGFSKMSRLEMLTSLRASMRKAANKVSFKSKKQKENSTILANNSAQSEQEATPTKDHPIHVRRHSDILETPLNSGRVDPPRGMRPRAYTDLTAQLSQPNLYYPPPPHSAYHHASTYQQLSQTYPMPPLGPFDDLISHAPRPPLPGDYPPRYAGVITPDYSDLTTPDHGHYGNPGRTHTPDQYLQHDDSASDDYPQHSTSPQRGGATSPSAANYTYNEGDDQFPLTSDPYRNSASHGGVSKPLPTVHERRYQFNDVSGPPDMFPPYNPDIFTSPSRRAGEELYMGGANMYPPPAMYPGNGYPIPPPPPGEYYEDMRRNSLDRSFRGVDPMGTFHERRSSYDQSAGGPYHPRRGSRDYEPRDQDNRRRSILSDTNSDLSASRTRVSWNTEVIEYTRTPSVGSDFDLNEL